MLEENLCSHQTKLGVLSQKEVTVLSIFELSISSSISLKEVKLIAIVI